MDNRVEMNPFQYSCDVIHLYLHSGRRMVNHSHVSLLRPQREAAGTSPNLLVTAKNPELNHRFIKQSSVRGGSAGHVESNTQITERQTHQPWPNKQLKSKSDVSVHQLLLPSVVIGDAESQLAGVRTQEKKSCSHRRRVSSGLDTSWPTVRGSQ